LYLAGYNAWIQTNNSHAVGLPIAPMYEKQEEKRNKDRNHQKTTKIINYKKNIF